MFIGIDLGTSEVKVLLLDASHQIVVTVREPLSVSRPHPQWSEQHPDQWWQATCRTMDRLAAENPQAMQAVVGIGLSGQMHGAVLLDETDRPLRPAILWNDGRCGAECAELMRREPDLPLLAGNLAMPGFTAPKLLWVARHEPEIFSRTRTVLLPKDWLRLQLTGEKVSDMSDASGTLWLDVAGRDWSDRLLWACGMNRDQMPGLVEGNQVCGQLRPEWVKRWKMPSTVLVAGGGGDNAASAVGIGAVQPGSGFLSLGTSGVIFVSNDRYRPNPTSAVHAFCHALPDRWHQMSVMLAAASSLAWATRLTGLGNEAALLAELAQLPEGAAQRAPLFLPYLSGERTPHNDPNAQGVLFGLSHDHGAADIAYAVLEGVTFGLLDGLTALRQAGTEVNRLSLIGGGARSPDWAQMLASALDVEIVIPVGGETGGALGAARLAWLACGADEETACAAPLSSACYLPDPIERVRLMSRYPRFLALYPTLREQFAT